MLPLPDSAIRYIDSGGKPTREFYNWLRQLQQGGGASGFSGTDVWVEDFGAVGDGVTDDTAAIQAAIDSQVAVGGGRVRFRLKDYLYSSTLNINASNIRLRGEGPDGLHDAGTPYPRTTLLWGGGAAPMVKFKTIYGPTAGIIRSCGFDSIALDGNSVATHGLYIDSVRDSLFQRSFVRDVVTAAYYTTCGVSGVDLAEAADTQLNVFRQLTFALISNPAVYGAHAFWLDGASNSDTSKNLFELCDGQTYDGHLFNMQACDNNVIIRCSTFNVGTGKSYVLYGADAGGKFCDNNVIIDPGWDPGGCVLLGTDSGFVAGSKSNSFLGIDNGDGADFPVLGDDCACVAIMGDGRAMGLKGTLVYHDDPTYDWPPEVETVLFGAACTVSLPDPDLFIHRRIRATVQTATAITSDAANVQPITGGALGTSILPATAGKWVDLQAFDSKWIKVAGN